MKSFARRTAAEPDPLKDFGEEAVPLATDSDPRRTALAVLAVLAVGIASIPYGLIRYSNAPALGTLTIESTPAGRRLVVDGVPRGATPRTVALPPGDHLVAIGEGPSTITLPVTTRSGEQLRQSVVFETTVVSDSPAVVPVTAVAESAKRAPAVTP